MYKSSEGMFYFVLQILPVVFQGNMVTKNCFFIPHTCSSLTRSSVMSENGITAKNWHSTVRTEIQMTPATEDTPSANSVMIVILTTTSCLNTCAGTITSATSVMQMALRNTTGKYNNSAVIVWLTLHPDLLLCFYLSQI